MIFTLIFTQLLVHFIQICTPAIICVAIFNHIKTNYHVKEVGLREGLDNIEYVILEKGEGQDMLEFLKSFSGKIQPRTIYKIFGRFTFFYVIRPETSGVPAEAADTT